MHKKKKIHEFEGFKVGDLVTLLPRIRKVGTTNSTDTFTISQDCAICLKIKAGFELKESNNPLLESCLEYYVLKIDEDTMGIIIGFHDIPKSNYSGVASKKDGITLAILNIGSEFYLIDVDWLTLLNC